MERIYEELYNEEMTVTEETFISSLQNNSQERCWVFSPVV